METLTNKALSIALNHSTTDELLRLRKENIALKSKLNRIGSNLKRYTQCIDNCDIILELVTNNEDDYERNVPFETLLDKEIDDDVDISDEQKKQILDEYNYNKHLIKVENFDHGMEVSVVRNIIKPLLRFVDKNPDTFEYMIKKLNPISFEYGKVSLLLPDYKMYVTMYDVTTNDGINSICNEYKLELEPTFKENQRNAIVQELESGLSHRIDIFLSKLNEWKNNNCIDELKPTLIQIDTDKEITIDTYVKYYLQLKTLASTDHRYEYHPCSLFRDNLDEYLRENNL